MEAMAKQRKAIVALYAAVANNVGTISSSIPIRYGVHQIRKLLDRMSGLKLLKNLPTGLEALIYYDDMTPDILAALSLGGDPGQKLATLGLMRMIYSSHHANLEELLNLLIYNEDAPLRTDWTAANASRMHRDRSKSNVLDGQAGRQMAVTRYMRVEIFSMQTELSLYGNTSFVVVGYIMNPIGVMVCGSTDGRFYYCENHDEKVQHSFHDRCPDDDKPPRRGAQNQSLKGVHSDPRGPRRLPGAGSHVPTTG